MELDSMSLYKLLFIKLFKHIALMIMLGIIVSGCSGSEADGPTQTVTLFTQATDLPDPTPTASPELDATATPIVRIENDDTPRLIGTLLPNLSEVITAENVETIEQFAQWGKGLLGDFAFSHDNRWLVVGTTTGLYFYETDDLDSPPRYELTERAVRSISVDPTGNHLAVGMGENAVQLWNPIEMGEDTFRGPFKEGADLFPAERFREPILFTKNGHKLVIGALVGGGDLDIQIYEVDEFSTTKIEVLKSPIFTMSPNDQWVGVSAVTGQVEENIEIIDFQSRESVYSLSVSGSSLAFLPNGKQILVGSQMFGVQLVDLAEDRISRTFGKLLVKYPIYDDRCPPPDYPPDEHRVPNLDRPIPDRFIISPDGEMVVVSYHSPTGVLIPPRLHKLPRGELLFTFPADVDKVEFSPEGDALVAMSRSSGEIRFYSVPDGEEMRILGGFDIGVADLKFLPGWEAVGVTYRDGVDVRSMTDGDIWRTHMNNGFAISEDGNLLALGTDSGKIEILNADDLSIVTALEMNELEEIWSMAFSLDGEMLATAGSDCLVNLWQVSDGSLVMKLEQIVLEDKAVGLAQLAWSPDGKMIAGAIKHVENITVIWDLETGEILHEIESFKDYLAYMPDGNSLMVGDETFDPDTGEEGNPMGSYGGNPVFSPNGELVVLEGVGGSVEIWSVAEGSMVTQIEAHREVDMFEYFESEINYAFSPDGTLLVTGGADGVVRVWGIPN